MKEICFYNKSDFDGKCAGAIVKDNLPHCEMIGWNYGDPIPLELIDKNTIVYIVDLSFPPDMMLFIQRISWHVVWIDHHDTALKDAEKYEYNYFFGIREQGIGACELTWRYFYPDMEVPKAVRLLALYDVWKHEDPDVLPFQYGLRIGSDEETRPGSDLWYTLFNNHFGLVEEYIHDGRLILEYETVQNSFKCKSIFFETEFIDGHNKRYDVIAANVGPCNSKFFDSYYDPKRHYMMVSFVRRSGKRDFSLYSTRDDIHCGEIAKQFGGGGHPGAAGFSLPSMTLPFKNW